MKKFNIKNSNALKEFESNVISTVKFIDSIDCNIQATAYFFKVLKTDKSKQNKKDQQIMEHLNLSLDNRSKLFEMGFIYLFANFEFFMYSLLKELFKQHPDSLGDDKIIKVKEISDFTQIKDLKAYIADKYAIQHSFDISEWSEFVEQKFNIKIFSEKTQKDHVEMLNELRNAYLHSGGHTNSKFCKKMGKFLKSKVPMDDKIGLDTEKNFKWLFHLFQDLTNKIRK